MVDQILTQLAKIPKINNGGCGFAAIAIWVFIKKQNPRSRPKIVLLDNDGGEMQDNKRAFENRGTLVRSANHIVVKWKGKYIDASSRRPRYNHKLEIPNPEPLKPVLADERKWNCLFDRDYVPKIAKIVGETENIFK